MLTKAFKTGMDVSDGFEIFRMDDVDCCTSPSGPGTSGDATTLRHSRSVPRGVTSTGPVVLPATSGPHTQSHHGRLALRQRLDARFNNHAFLGTFGSYAPLATKCAGSSFLFHSAPVQPASTPMSSTAEPPASVPQSPSTVPRTHGINSYLSSSFPCGTPPTIIAAARARARSGSGSLTSAADHATKKAKTGAGVVAISSSDVPASSKVPARTAFPVLRDTETSTIRSLAGMPPVVSERLPRGHPYVGFMRHAPATRASCSGGKEGLLELLWDGTWGASMVTRVSIARNQAWQQRHLSQSMVNELPVVRYSSNPIIPGEGPKQGPKTVTSEHEGAELLRSCCCDPGSARPEPGKTLEKQTICAICQVDFRDRDELRVLPCQHMFHRRCVDKWLVGSTSAPELHTNSCPLCKADIHLPKPPTTTTTTTTTRVLPGHIPRESLERVSLLLWKRGNRARTDGKEHAVLLHAARPARKNDGPCIMATSVRRRWPMQPLVAVARCFMRSHHHRRQLPRQRARLCP